MSGTTHTIVLVEDDTGLRAALERVLEMAGYRVESFASAEEVLAADAAERAGCIVCDVVLPGESGFALGRALSQGGPHAPVIFMTAHDRPAARAEAAGLGAAGYLVKPFAGRALIESIRAALAAPRPSCGET